MASQDVEKTAVRTGEDERSFKQGDNGELIAPVNKLIEHSHDADEAMKAYAGHEGEIIEVDEATNKRLLRTIDWHLLPLMCLIYGMNFLDKTTLSYASVMGLNKDIHLVGDNYQWLGSLFYIGYLIFEYPTTMILQRFPLAKTLSVCVVLWGITLACFAAVQNFAGAVAIRFLLGTFEASVTPGFALLSSQWYTQREQSTRVGIWFSFNGFAQIFGGCLAYGISKGYDAHGGAIAPWRILFIATGGLTSALGIMFWFVIPDNQLGAKWLSPRDRLLAVERVRVNQQGIGNKHFKMYQLKEALTDPLTYAIGFFGFIGQLSGGGIGTFFSQMIVSFGYTSQQSLIYATPAGAVLAVSLLLNGFLGSYTQQRILVSSVGLLIAILGVLLIVCLPLENNVGRLAGYFIAYFQSMPIVALLSLIASNVAGYTKKTTVAAIFLMCYCAANITAPQTFRPQDAPQYRPAEIVMIVAYAVAFVDLMFIWWWLKRQNAKKAAIRAQPGYVKLPNQEWLDLTDRENPEFVYSL